MVALPSALLLKYSGPDRMRSVFARVAKFLFNIWYRLCCILPRKNEILFSSRQTNEPGYNFLAIGNEFERRGWRVVYLTKRLSKRAAFAYAGHVILEIYHLARCRVCVLDRYDPVIGLLDFDCEPVTDADEAVPPGAVHVEFPRYPVIVQLWHAFGAFKKFGFQSLDTREGHKTHIAQSFGIHRNYTWIVCTGEQNRAAFAEAFSYPLDRIVPLGLPEYDDLLEKRTAIEKSTLERARPRILFAPTLRKSDDSPHPFRDLQRVWKDSLVGERADVTWSFHPLETGAGASLSVSEALLDADYVITDYSSIVYEAYVLGKCVAFYIPDIEDYRQSPGLNADPAKLAPNLAFDDSRRLMDFIEKIALNREAYPWEEFERFVGTTFSGCPPKVSQRIADFIEDRLLLDQ